MLHDIFAKKAKLLNAFTKQKTVKLLADEQTIANVIPYSNANTGTLGCYNGHAYSTKCCKYNKSFR